MWPIVLHICLFHRKMGTLYHFRSLMLTSSSLSTSSGSVLFIEIIHACKESHWKVFIKQPRSLLNFDMHTIIFFCMNFCGKINFSMSFNKPWKISFNGSEKEEILLTWHEAMLKCNGIQNEVFFFFVFFLCAVV